MAKAPFWLRGGKGKLAGSVLFKGEKGTVIRENVIPKNSQTDLQMRQRIAFGTVTQAAREMLPIIGISFEGITSEKLNRRRFVQINASTLGKAAKLGIDDCAWMTKGNNQLIPNPYIMSQGRLETPDILEPFFVQSAGPIPTKELSILTVNHTFPKKVMTPFELWEHLYGVGKGGQITLPTIFTLKGDNHFADYEDVVEDPLLPLTIHDFIRYSKFSAPRVVLKTSITGNFNVDFTQQEAPDWYEDIRAALDAAVDRDKSDLNFATFLEANGSDHTSGTTYAVEMDWTVFELDDDWQISAIGVILSKLMKDGSYSYNNCTLKTGHVIQVLSPSYYGCSLPFAYQSYLPSQNRNKNYLQTGGSGGNI